MALMDGFITVVDFETTSLEEGKRATEIGLVALDEQLRPIATYESVISAPIDPSPFALRHSKLTRTEIRAAPSFAELWPDIAKLFSGRVLVAHNATFEFEVIRQELAGISESIEIPPMFCTLEAARNLLPTARSKTLSDLCAMLGIRLTNAHEALADAMATAELLEHLVSTSAQLWEQLHARRENVVRYEVEATAKPPTPRIRVNENDSFSTFIDVLSHYERNHQRQILLTGEPEMGKEAFVKALEEVGLHWQESSPSKKTLYLVRANEGAGVSKATKAREKGVPVISEEQVLELIEHLRNK